MLRPRQFAHEYDPGPVLIQARKVHFDVSDIPLHWIPGHPVASNFASLLNIVLPPIERWFVAVFNEALPLVKDPRLAEDMRGFIGQQRLPIDRARLRIAHAAVAVRRRRHRDHTDSADDAPRRRPRR
jgi:predicted metal-dependent hydrolase